MNTLQCRGRSFASEREAVSGLLRRAGRGRAAALLVRVAWLLAGSAASGCTTIGLPVSMARYDFGPRQVVHLCVLRDEGISEKSARDIAGGIDREMDQYGIDVEVPWIRAWRRPTFFTDGILADVVARPLDPPCDRLLALVGRTTADRLWSLLLPQILGEVEDGTHTRGFAVGALVSLDPISDLIHLPPQTAVHEFYHMLGCSHALTMGGCYRQIALTKSYAAAAGAGFFPGLTQDLRPLSRAEVEARWRSWSAPEES